MSRSATYLRLIPARENTREGMLHVKTAPVKLTRAENDLHKSHPDGKFCVASLRNAVAVHDMIGLERPSAKCPACYITRAELWANGFDCGEPRNAVQHARDVIAAGVSVAMQTATQTCWGHLA